MTKPLWEFRLEFVRSDRTRRDERDAFVACPAGISSASRFKWRVQQPEEGGTLRMPHPPRQNTALYQFYSSSRKIFFPPPFQINKSSTDGSFVKGLPGTAGPICARAPRLRFSCHAAVRRTVPQPFYAGCCVIAPVTPLPHPRTSKKYPRLGLA